MTGKEYQKLAMRTCSIDDNKEDKLRARYPEGFDTEHSLNRTKEDI